MPIVRWGRVEEGRAMKVQIDVDRLREGMIDYYGSATFVGSPFAMGDVIAMEEASPTQLIRRAEREGIDLHKYVVPGSEEPDDGDFDW